jgi:hypothetical protein
MGKSSSGTNCYAQRQKAKSIFMTQLKSVNTTMITFSNCEKVAPVNIKQKLLFT